jgi:Cu(I)/Ag(I) efflux system membrane fusion protein
MKARTLLLFLLTAVLAAMGGWFAARYGSAPKLAEASNSRKILYYQSAMHPWIKSATPGNCTICGMKLTPVYEGEKGVEISADTVSLPTNSITVLNVQTEEVQRRPLVHTLRVAGRIEEDDTRHRIVSAYIDGRIDKLSINFVGAEVVEGQPLATFYSPQLLTAEREYLSLRRNASALATHPVDSAVLDAEQTNLLRSAAQRLKRLGLTDAQVEQLAKKEETDTHTEIRAPISGTVVSRFVYEGQYVKEGDKLFEISDFSTMWFVFDAYERDLAWIRPGEMVDVTTPAVPGKVFAAPITFVDPNLNDMTRSAKVRVEVPNPLVEENGRKRRPLFHRLFAEGVVKTETPETLVVPRTAVLAPGPEAVAYVDLSGGSYQRRTLKLGRIGDDGWEVIEGLHQGERVVTAGNLLIDAQAQLNQSAQQGAVPAHEEHTLPLQTSAATGAAPQATVDTAAGDCGHAGFFVARSDSWLGGRGCARRNLRHGLCGVLALNGPACF